MRSHGRSPSQTRPIRITTQFTKIPLGSVLCEFGETRVMCTVHCEEAVPNWMRRQKGSGGWVTAEYSLLPGSTQERSKRERQNVSGRTQEIQRLLGRCLRAVVDLKQLGERTLTIDCDVLQADGGTRTASLTGAWVALKLAVDTLIKQGTLKTNPIVDSVAAVSVGLVNGQSLVDLDFQEDQKAEVDLTVVLTGSGKIVEVQGCAEKQTFTREQLNRLLDLAHASISELTEEQQKALV